MLEVKSVTCGYNKKPIISNVSFNVKDGDVVCLLGPNGVGKTTLFKTILGFLPLLGGEIILDKNNAITMARKEFAKKVAYVPQAHVPPFPYKVLDVVVMGRAAHLGSFASPSSKDYHKAEKVLVDLGVAYLKDKIYTEVSGGERQLVLIARALIQEPNLLIMDEPTSNLDFGNQIKVIERVRSLSKKNMGIIMTSHVPNHAFMCADKVVAMGRHSIRVGECSEILTEETLKELYNLDVAIKNIVIDETHEEYKVCIPKLK
ncbi:ABC transporter ATP-binding protein [Clostridium hydrogeniformans]|uniref:ABC transporter ATP-binding protein n=1 Tax=Clostridium hydrogeniformans TaxID=349933 RepID=UPI000A70007E|nr:ABC transporter ATP-binding protein [Clostridium hydrogeniformans]